MNVIFISSCTILIKLYNIGFEPYSFGRDPGLNTDYRSGFSTTLRVDRMYLNTRVPYSCMMV